MNQDSFSIAIQVDQTPEQAFSAINDPRSWWTGTIEGCTDALGGEFTYRYQDLHLSKQQVTELVPNSKVVWTVTESALRFAEHQDEWTGTKIVFEIARKGDKTEIRFTHRGLVPHFDCYGACSKGWTQLIHALGALLSSQPHPALKSTARSAERRV